MSDSAGFVFTDIFCLHTEKLYNSTGRELRRALFSLKQIFQVCDSLFHPVPDLKKSAEEVAADVLLAYAESSCVGIVLLKRAGTAQTLPSWQLCCVQAQSPTHTHTHTDAITVAIEKEG